VLPLYVGASLSIQLVSSDNCVFYDWRMFFVDFRPINFPVSATLVCRLIVSSLVIHESTWITTHLPTLKGWKAELAWSVDP